MAALFTRAKREVATAYRAAAQTGAGGFTAVNKMKQSNKIVFNIIKDGLHHQKLLKLNVPDAGLYDDDEDVGPPASTSAQARERERTSSNSGASRKSLQSCLQEIKDKKAERKKRAAELEAGGSSSDSDGSSNSSSSSNGSKSSRDDALGYISSDGSPRRSPKKTRPPRNPTPPRDPTPPREATPPPPGDQPSSPFRYRPRSASPDHPNVSQNLRASPPPIPEAEDVQDQPLPTVNVAQQGPSLDDQIKEQRLAYWRNKAKVKEAKVRFEVAKAKKEEEKAAWTRDKRRALLKRYFPDENLPPRLDHQENNDDDDNAFGGPMF